MRSSLLAAGFHVARGVPSGPKEETTIALALDPDAVLASGPGALAAHPLLDRAWLDRRARSAARFAADIAPELHVELEHAIQAHPQFARHPAGPTPR